MWITWVRWKSETCPGTCRETRITEDDCRHTSCIYTTQNYFKWEPTYSLVVSSLDETCFIIVDFHKTFVVLIKPHFSEYIFLKRARECQLMGHTFHLSLHHFVITAMWSMNQIWGLTLGLRLKAALTVSVNRTDSVLSNVGMWHSTILQLSTLEQFCETNELFALLKISATVKD